MRKDPQLVTYKNGVLVRLKDRQVFVQKRIFKDGTHGYTMETRRIIHGRTWKTVRVRRGRFDIVEASWTLSYEAISGIFQAISIIEERGDEMTSIQPRKNKSSE